MSAIPAISALRAPALCLRLSASDPPPIAPLLKTKAEVTFERPVKGLSRPFFPVFQGFNRGQFQPCFLVPDVRSAEGRNRSPSTKYQVPAPLANCQLLAACFKD